MKSRIQLCFFQLLNERRSALLLNENRLCARNAPTTHDHATRVISHLQARQSSSVTVAIFAALERMTLAFDELLLKVEFKNALERLSQIILHHELRSSVRGGARITEQPGGARLGGSDEVVQVSEQHLS